MDDAKEKNSSKNIRLGAVLGYVALILSIVSGLVYTPWIKDVIGKNNYGLYTLSTSLVNLFLIDFGLSVTANTFLAKYRADNDEKSISIFLTAIYRIFFVLDALILLCFTVVYFCINYIYAGLTPDEINSLKVIFLIAAGFSVLSFPCTVFSGVLQAYEKFIALKVADILQRVFYIVGSAIVLVLGGGLYGVVLANFGSALLCHFFRYVFLRHETSARANFQAKISKSFVKQILFYSGWAAIQSIGSRFVFNIMPSILGIVSNSNNIATFGFIAQLEGYVYLFGNVMGGFFLPKIARLQKERNAREAIDRFAIKVAKIQFFFVGLIFVGFLCCGIDFVNLWLSHDSATTEIYVGTLLIISYQLFFVPEMVYYNEMYLANHVRPLAIGSIVKAVLNCILAFLLGYFYGAIGAAISVFISRIFELIYINVAYKKYLNVPLGSFFIKSFGKPLLPFFIAVTLGLALYLLLPLKEIYRFIATGICVVACYSLIYWFFALNKEEKSSIMHFLSKKK